MTDKKFMRAAGLLLIGATGFLLSSVLNSNQQMVIASTIALVIIGISLIIRSYQQ